MRGLENPKERAGYKAAFNNTALIFQNKLINFM
jgi:hypothetical protein